MPFLSRLRNAVWSRPSKRQWPRKGICQPGLEVLEARDVPTVLFEPQLGPEARVTENDYGMPYFNGPALSNTAVHLIFEGSYWQNPTGINVTDVLRSANNILYSGYLSGLNQYGSNGK